MKGKVENLRTFFWLTALACPGLQKCFAFKDSHTHVFLSLVSPYKTQKKNESGNEEDLLARKKVSNGEIKLSFYSV